jgi:hypothetical protein
MSNDLIQKLFASDADPKDVANGGVIVASEDWTPIPDNVFFHTCCGCKLSHYVEIKDGAIRFEMREDLTKEHLEPLKDNPNEQ